MKRAISKSGPLARVPWASGTLGIWTIGILGAIYVSQRGGSPPIGTPISGPVAQHSYTLQPNIAGRRIGRGPNCDCGSVDFGLLTAEFRAQCLGSEARLNQLASQGKLGLKVENGKLVAGEFCDSNSGPRAWPVLNGPASPPAGVPEGQPCTPSGLAKSC